MPSVTARLNDDLFAGLRRLAEPQGGNVSRVLQELIAEKVGELAGEAELIGALDHAYRRLQISLSPSPAGALAVIDKAEQHTTDAPPVEQIAAVAAREHAGHVAVELVGVGDFAGTRVLLMVAPAGRRLRFEVLPSELTPASEG
jgi:hypothetical protein